MGWLLVALWQLCYVALSIMADEPDCKAVRVNTTSGLLEGCEVYVTLRKRNLKQFLGVPYAEQPTGPRRLRRPEEKRRMEGVVDAKKFGKYCPQINAWFNANFTRGEDCLWLNIYVPDTASLNNTVDVMLYIHGGSYLDGTGNFYTGVHLALVGDVIVVTINYRLGLLGFLSAEDKTLMGNFGLWDQLMALQWVQKNIGKFGGDPKRVTLFGNSAGSSSVGLLALSPKTEGLFRRIITQSGSPLSPWALVQNPKRFVEFLSQEAQCTPNINQTIVDCLRSRTVGEIFSLQLFAHQHYVVPEGGLLWCPWVDGEVILYGLDQLIANSSLHNESIVNRFGQYDHLIGVTSQEAAFVYESKMKQNIFTENDYDRLLREVSLSLVPGKYAKTLESAMRFAYRDFNVPSNPKDRVVQYIDIYSDFAIYVGALSFAQFHEKVSKGRGKTFLYMFDHRGTWKSREDWRVGATHEDELPFVFGYPELYEQGTRDEQSLAETMMIFWSNFAKNGDPNIGKQPGNFMKWPPFELGTEKYIKFAMNKSIDISVREKLYARRHKFWTEFFPEFRRSLDLDKQCTCESSGYGRLTLSMYILMLIFLSLGECLQTHLLL